MTSGAGDEASDAEEVADEDLLSEAAESELTTDDEVEHCSIAYLTTTCSTYRVPS